MAPIPKPGRPASQAILLLDHGSRQNEANEAVVAIAARIRDLQPGFHVEYAHMEIADPDFFAGVSACARAGAARIIVQPWFLGDGRHTRETIPALVAEAERRFPALEFRIAAHLGTHDKLIEVALERIADALGR